MLRQRGNKNFGTIMRAPVAILPSNWELFLRSLRLSETDAHRILNERPDANFIKIKNWVSKNYRIVYVPESVLETFGLEDATFYD